MFVVEFFDKGAIKVNEFKTEKQDIAIRFAAAMDGKYDTVLVFEVDEFGYLPVMW